MLVFYLAYALSSVSTLLNRTDVLLHSWKTFLTELCSVGIKALVMLINMQSELHNSNLHSIPFCTSMKLVQ